MNKIIRAFESIFTGAGYASGVALIASMFLILIEVFTRYALAHPLTVSEEYSGYALVAITFLGFSYTLYQGGHLRITFAVKLMPTKLSNWLRVVTLTLAFGWVLLASIVSVSYVRDSFIRGIRSITPQMTLLAWPRLVIPLGFFLFSIALAIEVVKTIRAIKAGTDVEKEAEVEIDE